MDAVFLPSDAELAASLAQLKTQVASNASTADANLSEGLLKRALWAKHNDVKASERLLGAYSDWHTRTLGSPSMRLSIVHVHAFLLTGILEVLPNVKDRDGLPIVYMRPNSYLPGVIPWQHVVNALVYLLEFLTTTDETAAKYGFTFICDMKDWGWSNFGTSYAANFFAILSGRFPVRIRKFILVNPPSIFPLVWKIIKPMMGAELASKFQFTTSAQIDSLVELKNLPVEIGGTHDSVDMADFVKAQYANEGIQYEDFSVNAIEWKKYKITGLKGM